MRSDLPQRDVGKRLRNGVRRSDPPFCAKVLQQPFRRICGNIELGVTQHIAQGEGGDFLMLMLFRFGPTSGPHRSPSKVVWQREVVLSWTTSTSQVCRAASQKHTPSYQKSSVPTQGSNFHHGNTKVWNRGGVEPEGIAELTRMARRRRPDAVVRKEKPAPATQSTRPEGFWRASQLGQPEFVRDFLEAKTREQAILFQRIPWARNTQAAFLLRSHVCIDDGRLLVEGSPARLDRGVRRAPRHSCVEMSPCDLGNTLSTG